MASKAVFKKGCDFGANFEPEKVRKSCSRHNVSSISAKSAERVQGSKIVPKIEPKLVQN